MNCEPICPSSRPYPITHQPIFVLNPIPFLIKTPKPHQTPAAPLNKHKTMIFLDPPNSHLSYPEMIGRTDLFGMVNGFYANFSVYKKSSPGFNNARERYEEIAPLQHPNISRFCVEKTLVGNEDIFYIFCYETEKVRITNFSFSSFKQTKKILKQILASVNWIHGNQFLHLDLHLTSSFFFEKKEKGNGFVSARLDIRKCVKDDPSLEWTRRIKNQQGMWVHVKGKHTKQSNFNQLSVAVAEYFKIGGLSLPKRDCDCYDNLERVAYTVERNNLLDLLAGSSIQNNHCEFRNHPLFWNSERRIRFLVDVFEACSSGKHAGLETAIYEIRLEDEVGSQWKLFEEAVCLDLGLTFRTPVCALSLLSGLRNHSVHLLKNRFIGQAQYRAYDVDSIKGLDLMISFLAPKLFMGVFSALQLYWENKMKQIEKASLVPISSEKILELSELKAFSKYLFLNFDADGLEFH